MADISAELAAIKSAVYGEEVRDSIHDGLYKMNDQLNTAIGTQVLTIDKTLSVSNSAADAKVVGTKALINDGLATSTAYTSCDDIHENSILFVSSSGGATSLSNFAWSDSAGWLVSIQTNNFTLQVAYPYNTTSLKPKNRRYTGSAWSAWSDIFIDFSEDVARLRNALVNKGLATDTAYTSCDDVQDNSIYFVSSSGGATSLTNYAFDAAGWLISIRTNNFVLQFAYPYNTTSLKPKYRRYTGSAWSGWSEPFFDYSEDIAKIVDANSSKIIYTTSNKTSGDVQYIWNGESCTVTGSTTSTTNSNALFSSSNSFPGDLGPGKMLGINITATNVLLQVYVYIDGSTKSIYSSTAGGSIIIPYTATGIIIRLCAKANVNINETLTVKLSVINNDAMLLSTIANYGFSTYMPYASCDEMDKNGIYFVTSSGGATSLTDFAYTSAGWLQTIITTSFKFQIAYPYDTTTLKPMFRRCNNGVWTEWVPFGGQTINNYTTTTIERGTYNNTYNITTSPTITTDSNGWLQSVDTDTSDETNKTDMTGAIMSMLTDTGYCHLGPGIFYVSGSIDMPAYSTLEGCGKKSEIRLLSRVTSGYCIKVTNSNTVKNLYITGARGQIDTQTSGNIGSRDAIHIGVTGGFPCVITNCFIRDFAGSAIYQYDNGGSVQGYAQISDCLMLRCKVGINIAYHSEYCKYTNNIINRAYYACINNGGNNVFVGCTFHGVIGFLLDNSNDDKANNAHGSVMGCTFNHIDNVNHASQLGMGLAVKMINATNGFIFDGCQFWYGEIYLENSRGISFSNCLIGGGTPSIEVYGDYPAFFSDCIFHQSPDLSNVNASTKFNNCYLDSDGSVVKP